MLKAIKLMIVVLLLAVPASGQSKEAAIGTRLEQIVFDKVIKGDPAFKDLHALKGKVTILDFWATWCTPCIRSMAHLNELHKKFYGKLNVVIISNEPATEIHRYLNKQKWPFVFVQDSTQRLAAYFPHLTIPHTILVDEHLNILAITDPYNITEGVIQSVLNGEQISLYEKRFEHFEQDKDYMPADTLVERRFLFAAAISSLPTRLQTWHNHKVFAGRRFTAINFTVVDALEKTYPNAEFKQVVYDSSCIADTALDITYCFDMLVERERTDSLFSDFRKELLKNFEINCRIDTIPQPVFLLKRKEGITFQQSVKPHLVYPSDDGHHYKADSIAVSTFIKDFLFGFSPLPVIDETGLTGCYDIDFQFDFQKAFPQLIMSSEFTNQLDKIGFRIEEAVRAAPTLVIYK